MLLRRHADALADYRKALEQNPSKAIYLVNVADGEALMGQADSARHHYERALEQGRNDRSASALMWKAQCLAHLGRSQEAVANTEEALRLEPENSELIYQAALVFILVGDRTNALVNARKAVDKGVDSRWLSLVWFDSLKSDSEFARLLKKKPTG